jgi:hypothetical protein
MLLAFLLLFLTAKMTTLQKILTGFALITSIATSQAALYTISYSDGNGGTITNTYDITITSTAPFNFPGLQTVSSGSPWWGNANFAEAAATAVGGSLFIGNQWYNNGFGPSFAYSPFSNSGFATYIWAGGPTAAGNYNEYGVGPFALGTLVAPSSGGGGSNVPDGASTVLMLALTATGIAALRRRLTRA